MRAREQRPDTRENCRSGRAGQLLIDDGFGQRTENARRIFQFQPQRTHLVDDARECTIGRTEVVDGDNRVVAEPDMVIEQSGLGVRSAFDREHLQFCRNSTAGRKSADFAVGSEHAMARHDDRKRIAAKSLANRARKPGAPSCAATSP